jgi:hypothetical protein
MSRATRRPTDGRSSGFGPGAAVQYCDLDHTLHRTDAYRTKDGLMPGSPDTPFLVLSITSCEHKPRWHSARRMRVSNCANGSRQRMVL